MFDSRSTKTNTPHPLESLPAIVLPTYPEKKGETRIRAIVLVKAGEKFFIRFGQSHANAMLDLEYEFKSAGYQGNFDLISTGFFQWTNRGLVSLALEDHAKLPISPEELSHRLSEMFPGVSNEVSEAI